MNSMKKRKEYIQLNCQNCNSSFELVPNVYRARLKTRKNFFCSKLCSQKYRIGKSNNINYTPELMLKIKETSKKKKYSTESKYKMIENGKNSKNLFKKGHKIHEIYPELKNNILTTQKKETHWNWKGGIYKEILLLRGTANYINWRKEVFERDNYTCVKCKKRNCYLHAHHIIHFAQIYYQKIQNLMWDTKNGITLCKDCHYLEHKGVNKINYAKTI
jgi:hypothetical protein